MSILCQHDGLCVCSGRLEPSAIISNQSQRYGWEQHISMRLFFISIAFFLFLYSVLLRETEYIAIVQDRGGNKKGLVGL